MHRFRRLFAHDDWANRETLASLKAAGTPPERARRFLAHIVGAEQLWLARLQSVKSSLPVWPELNLDECAGKLDGLRRDWGDYLGRLKPADLNRGISYVNSKGEPWSSTVDDVLTHVIMHSTYHRGQIATELRAAGKTPAYTDFIHAARLGLLPASGGAST